MEAAILFGNGVNRLDPACPCWWKLLMNLISDKSDLEKIQSQTLLFEAIVLSKIVVKTNYAKQIKNVKQEIAKEFKSADYITSVLEELAILKVEHYLTTNYDNSILKYFKIGEFKKENFGERFYNIHRKWFCKNKTLWKIHGDAQCPDSIMLGFEQYGRNLTKIGEYVTGNYKPNHKSKRKPPILSKINSGFPKECYSWIDLFFTHDIHIIGLGLNQEEQDLWWILVYRISVISGNSKCKNKIFYYTFETVKVSDEKVFQVLGVTIVKCDNPDIKYEDKYKCLIEKMKHNIQYRRKANSLVNSNLC